MSSSLSAIHLTRTARAAASLPPHTKPADTCIHRSSLSIRSRRHFQTSTSLQVVPKFRKDGRATTTQFASSTKAAIPNQSIRERPQPKSAATATLSAPDPDAAVAAAKAKQKEQEDAATAAAYKMGGLADNSLFAEEKTAGQASGPQLAEMTDSKPEPERDPTSLESRNFNNIGPVLNPRPTARSRWQRRMVIRQVHRRGRLTKAMVLARTERTSLSKSHFFKTSMKKLAPLARQIAGKPIDEAILQMRFSKKKAAKDVRKHLIQARDEAIVARGMGLGLPSPAAMLSFPSEGTPKSSPSADSTPAVTEFAPDPSIAPALPHQNPTKSYKAGHQASETDIYISQAWVNRGPYGKAPDYRAFGRMNIMRPPHTGLSVMLKEEKTRTRIKDEKEAKAIRRRMGKSMWTQLPDRKIQGPQGQYVLW